MLKGILLIPALVLKIVGLSMSVRALKYRTDQHPGIMKLNPKYWKPLWKMKDYYSPEGYRMNLHGSIIFGIGGLFDLAWWLL